MLTHTVFDLATFITNQYFKLDSEFFPELKTLAGSIIQFHIKDFSLNFYLQIKGEQIKLSATTHKEADVILRGGLFNFLKMANTMRADNRTIPKNIEIIGDIELLEKFSAIIKRIDIDFEEQLSKVLGDALAHSIGNGVRYLLAYGKQLTNTFEKNMGEYLQEEAKALPCHEEVEDFFEDITILSNDVDRIEARIKKISNYAHN